MESPSIHITSTNTPVFIKAFSRTVEGGLSLRAGDVVQAKVTASSQGNAVLSIGGVRVPVSTSVPLNPGDTISLMVVEIRPDRVVLRLLDGRMSGAGAVKQSRKELIERVLQELGFSGRELASVASALRGANIELGSRLGELLRGLTALSGTPGDGIDRAELLALLEEAVINSSDAEEITVKIKAMVRALGNEASLAGHLAGDPVEPGELTNLKSRLLELRFALQGQTSGSADASLGSLRTSVERLLELLTSAEVLNLPVDARGRYVIYLPLPVRVGDEMRTAEVRIYTRQHDEEKRSRDASSFAVAFALEMPSLGKTRALLESVKKVVSFSIAIESGDGLREATLMLDELRISLEGLGYTVANLSATALKQSHAGGQEARSLIEEKFGITLEGIDVKA